MYQHFQNRESLASFKKAKFYKVLSTTQPRSLPRVTTGSHNTTLLVISAEIQPELLGPVGEPSISCYRSANFI